MCAFDWEKEGIHRPAPVQNCALSKKRGPQRKDFGGRYGFSGFDRDFVSTADLESFALRPAKFPKRFSFGGGLVRFFPSLFDPQGGYLVNLVQHHKQCGAPLQSEVAPIGLNLGKSKRGLSKRGLSPKGADWAQKALSREFLLPPHGCEVRRNRSQSAPKRPG